MLFRLIELIAILGLSILGEVVVVVHDDVIVLENVPISDVHGALVECTNLCVHSVNATSVGLAGCYELCQKKQQQQQQQQQNNASDWNMVPGGDFHFSAEMICKTDTRLTLQINSNADEEKMSRFGGGVPAGLFVMELNAPVHVVTYLATASLIHLRDLHPRTQYLSSGFVVSSTNRIEMIDEESFTTLPEDFQPESVTNISLPAFDVHNGESLSMRIRWQVPDQRGCTYNVIWHAEDEETHPQEETLEINSRNDSLGELFTLDHLRFGTSYKLAIRGKSAFAEGPVIWLDINTPSCLEWSGYDLDQCPPATPERLTIDEVTSLARSSHYDIKVSWKAPKVAPDNYTIQLVDMDTTAAAFVAVAGEEEPEEDAHRVYSANITTGNATSFQFKSIALHGTHFEIVLVAHSPGGSSAEAFATKFFDYPTATMTANERLIKDVERLILILLPIALLVGVVLFVGHVFVRSRRKLFRYEDACLYARQMDGHGFASMDEDNYEAKLTLLRLPIDDQMELCREDIELLNDLGEGEFGLVKLGRLQCRNFTVDDQQVSLKSGSQLVAIKMLKHSPTTDEIAEFRREIDVMKSVGAHTNVVSIVGHYTRNINELMLLTEFCPRGNLLNYLHRIWKVINDDCCFAEDGMYQEIGELTNAVENKGYMFTRVDPVKEISSSGEEEEIVVPTQTDLLQIALQIALGMEYLSKNRVIHRDLAARNVLLCGDRTVKIADFGLSRDIYQSNVYRKKSNGKLPIKWMAIESLSHQIYTSQSDVWSYGIVLYELMTYGSTPYPSVSNEAVLELITTGYRMERPVNCEDYVYDLMLACWNVCANNRPHFSSIVDQVQKMLEALESAGLDKDVLRTTSMEGGVPTAGFCDEMFI